MRLPLLVFHISGGIIGLLSGAVAMVCRKGLRGHRIAGDVFVVSMLVMGACGSILALMKHQINNVFGGVLTFYMISTAWLAGRRRDGVGIFDWAATAMAFGIATGMFTLGMRVVKGIDAQQENVPLAMYFIMGAIPLLAAVGDIRVLVRGGISGKHRLARHLWRMCFGLFIASGSFFLGQQQVFPESWRGSPLFFIPALLPLVLLIFWLCRVLFTSAYRKLPLASVGGVASMRT
jgi:uncharacterized membrane protein